MTTKPRNAAYDMAIKINAHLANLPAHQRPQTTAGHRIASVAYSANGYYEATSDLGTTDYVTAANAAAWLKKTHPRP